MYYDYMHYIFLWYIGPKIIVKTDSKLAFVYVNTFYYFTICSGMKINEMKRHGCESVKGVVQ